MPICFIFKADFSYSAYIFPCHVTGNDLIIVFC